MLETFECPHCSNSYPILPTLVGRKVRCTHCKLAFQLQYDGIALKIQTGKKSDKTSGVDAHKSAAATTDAATSALEARGAAQNPEEKSSALNTPDTDQVQKQLNESGPQTLGAKQVEPKSHVGVRPQTKALRRRTDRIKKIRSSLQGAAQQALEGIEQDVQALGNAEEAAVSARPVTSKLAASTVRLSGNAHKQRQLNKRIVLCVFIVIALIAAIPFLITEKIERSGLTAFTADLRVEETVYPLREQVYRGRMWVYTRDGKLSPPLVLNVDRARTGTVQSVDWPETIAACSPDLDGMILSRRFALWHKKGQSERLEQLWKSCPNKRNSEGFFQYLSLSKFSYFRADALPGLLLKRGTSKQACYVLSMLLAGTCDKDGSACQDFGLRGDVIPSRLQWCEFHGHDGNLLQDEGGLYGAATAKEYSGLLVGFTGFSGLEQRADEWRILDLRLAAGMEAFYAAKHNPLQLMSVHAYELLREEAKKTEMLESADASADERH